MPTRRGRNQLDAASGTIPRRAKTKPKRASLIPFVRDQAARQASGLVEALSATEGPIVGVEPCHVVVVRRSIDERELGLDTLNLSYPLTGIGISYLLEGNPQRPATIMSQTDGFTLASVPIVPVFIHGLGDRPSQQHRGVPVER